MQEQKRVVRLNGDNMLKNAKMVATVFESSYVPKNVGAEADICINRCPQPEKDCKGRKCEFFKKEYKKLKIK